jgi:hypothetical protein
MKRTQAPIAGLLFALLVLAALPFSAAQSACADATINSVLRFGQALALADFDNDGKLDRARVASAGLRSSIEIRLGLAGPSSWLHFEALNNAPGSLFSQDLDHDGDADLIWTDLRHADAVVVWLGDGTGRFERVGADQFAPDFTHGGFNLTLPEEDNREQASDDETNSSVALEVNSHCMQARAPAMLNYPYHQGVLPLGAPRRTTSRGPPSFLI